jgi:hypothetical protein
VKSDSYPWQLLVLAAIVITVIGLAPPELSRAKELEVGGTADCGLRSGWRCSVSDVLVLMTDDLTGTVEPVRIDVSRMLARLPTLDQGDEVVLLVQDTPNGLRALSVADVRKGRAATHLLSDDVDLDILAEAR